MYKEREFTQLRGQLIVNEARLSQELAEHPMVLMEVAEHCAGAISNKDRADAAVKLAMAQAAAELRVENIGETNSPKYRSAAAVTAELTSHEYVVEATAFADTAKYEAALWIGLAEGMRAKGSSLKRIAELITSGYMVASSNASYATGSYDASRDELNTARRAAREAQEDARARQAGRDAAAQTAPRRRPPPT